uniref:Neur_chan_LBD domain-containing protein n=1 Tax=Bursaphelenchus xylophilus TaxID=6326 RepID=A0A1I7SN74_BURXY
MSDSESRRIQSIKVTTLPHKRTAQIEFLYPTLYKFSCTLDLRMFPYDEQSIKVTTLPHKRTAQIEFLYPTLYKFSCTLDLRMFPYDEQ